MRTNKLILIILTLLPWLSLPLMKKKTFKRFYPAAIFMGILVALEGLIAKKRKWWVFYEKLPPYFIPEVPLIAGPFFIGTLWIMKFAFGKPIRFILLNFVVASFFTYVLINWFTKRGIATLVHLKKYQLSLLFLLKSIILYVLQTIYEKVKA
ncbi:hypothetical protein [Litchfieldia alkalitelluris]|uniref:hypothetical protein n=1 Tax=Litchfieldia alkalitelluris TaxID=304268 RepID=UPI0009983412|nr:hypothetical protein [Litchfieldia alkalitelluris]